MITRKNVNFLVLGVLDLETSVAIYSRHDILVVKI